MDLIPLREEGVSRRPVLRVNDEARALMDIRTTPVQRRFVEAEIRMVGKVAYDETRVGHITAWVAGRLDRLYADYTGIEVRKGDHMVRLFSPELVSAQGELLESLRAYEELGSSRIAGIREGAAQTVQAARDKLRLLGLKPDQVQRLEETATVEDHVIIYAPMGGTVVEKHAQEGMYVETGTRIYTIVDLGRVWVKLDAYEQDLQWLRYGQKVSFTSEAHPGEAFDGTIVFIAPVVDPHTRTVKVRVNAPNPDRKLKPEMLVRGLVRAGIAMGGKVMEPDLAGKWISPMHPEIVKDGPGKCDVCGMDLVPAESLGYVAPDPESAPLVIPASAPLITGKRAVVYVEVPEAEEPTFEGREVTLGPRAGGYYVVREGLQEGEIVVTRGSFRIDSALQIQARPSMMSPGEGEAAEAVRRPEEPAHQHGPAEGQAVPVEFRTQLNTVWDAYVALHGALASDDADEAATAVAKIQAAVGDVDTQLLEGTPAAAGWDALLPALNGSLEKMHAAGAQLGGIREHLDALSEAVARALCTYANGSAGKVYMLHCPMAAGGEGAGWLQADKEVRNPYYGPSMLNCGEVQGPVLTGKSAGESPHEHH
jgi:Cu(I)/Ag(I) efflux system membrane fusion protein